MKQLLLLTAIFLTACGPSTKEKEEIAIITCNIMGESRNMDGAVRIKEINAAREKMGEDSFLGSDDVIKQSFEYGLCKELVLNDGYETKLETAFLNEKEVIRIRKQQTILDNANNKQLVKELLDGGNGVSLSPDGNVEMIRMMKNNVLHGELKRFHRNGELLFKVMYENGQKEGIQESYDDDGNLTAEKCFKDGSEVSLEKCT